MLFLIGVRMIFPSKDGVLGPSGEGEPFIVPSAILAVAGPSTMTVLLLFAIQQPLRLGSWNLSLFLVWLATAAIPSARKTPIFHLNQ